MPTIINNPGQGTSNDGGTGLIIGIIIAIALIILFVIYGIPALREGSSNNTGETTNINVEVPNPVETTE